MTTRLLKLPVDEYYALLLAFQNAGMTLEQARDVVHNPRKAKLMVDALVQASSPIKHEQVLAQADQSTQSTPADKHLVSGKPGRPRDSSSPFVWEE